MHKAHVRPSFFISAKSSMVILLFVLFYSHTAHTQNLSQSPYSYYGLGDMQYMGSAMFGSMGQVSQGIRRRFDINTANPASYSALAQTNIEAGGSLTNGVLKYRANQTEVSLSGLSYFNIGTSISKKGLGISFGAAPFSALGYEVKSTNKIQTDTSGLIDASLSQIGSGGITKAYIGLGAKVHKNVSVGVNIGYLFGQINTQVLQTIPPEYYMFNWSVDKKDYVSDFLIDYGIQTHFDSVNISLPKRSNVVDSNGFEHKAFVQSKKNYVSVTAGFTFNLQTDLNATQRYSFRTLTRGGVDFARDSIQSDDNRKGAYTMPMSLKYGVCINGLNWSVAADVMSTAWENFRHFGINDGLQNSLSVGVGGSWVPDLKEDARNYLKRLEYRAGYRFEKTNLNLSGQSVNVIAYSIGIGIPIADRDRYKKFSRVNIGFDYMTRGANTTLVNEEYMRFTIGMVFSDRWFIKYKYD